MSDCFKVMIEIIMRFCGSKNDFPRFYDMVNHTEKKSEPEKSAEEIIEEVTRNAGLTAI